MATTSNNLLVISVTLFVITWTGCGVTANLNPLTCNRCEEQILSELKVIKLYLAGVGDCTDISQSGKTVSGVYRINNAGYILDVYCDLHTPKGGWLVFQRRRDGQENFFRDWISYQKGFGNLLGEFWLGNDILHQLTSARRYKLRIDLEDFTGAKRYAEYSTFSIGSSATNYKLTVGGYKGDAGDSFSYQNGMQFSTRDADHDAHVGSNCAAQYKGAWWYTACHQSNLNGAYLKGKYSSYADGVVWYTWLGHYYSLKMTEMKIALSDN